MNEIQFHLAINHFPIIIPIIGAIVLVGGMILKSEIVKRTAFFILIMGSVSTAPAFISGEGAEELAENIQGIDEQYIETHEDISKQFMISSYVLGILSLIGLWANWQKKAYANRVGYLVIFCAAIVLYFAKQTGTSGGEIRHTEIRENQKSLEPAGKAED